MTVACPDCTATTTGRRLEHDHSCPLGQAIDEVCAADRRWFQRLPFATERHRRITPAEIAELQAFGVLAPGVDPSGWRVHITQLEPGVRARQFLGKDRP